MNELSCLHGSEAYEVRADDVSRRIVKKVACGKFLDPTPTAVPEGLFP
jgi:hypothetical protein